jgi:hypothetical protein
MKGLGKILLILVAAVILLLILCVYAACIVSGRLSRAEEENSASGKFEDSRGSGKD